MSSLLFALACSFKLPILLRYVLRTFYHNPPIVLFCHRVLPPKSRLSRIDEFYHRLGHPTVEEFESQLRYLSSYHSVVSLEEVVDFIIDGKRLPANPVALTFDDGYRDNFKHGFLGLEKYQFRATFFLCTDFIETGDIPFHDQLIYGFCFTNKKRLKTDDDYGKQHEWDLGIIQNKVDAFLSVQKILKDLPYSKRRKYVKHILSLLEVSIDDEFRENLMLTWKDIETMHLAGHVFHSHTRTHPLLTTLDKKELEDEILGSKMVIDQKELNNRNYFCYPYGKAGEFNDTVIHFLKTNGFAAACTAIHGLNRFGDGPYRIKRTALISESIHKFSLRAAGLFEII